MRRMIALWACMWVCLSLLSGCMKNKDVDAEFDLDNSVEINFDTDAAGKGDIEFSPDNNDVVYDFKDPNNADGIVVAPKE